MSDVQLESARSINNAGQILALGYASGGESTEFFLLTPGTCDAGGQSLALRRGISALTTESPKLTIVEPCGLTTLRIDATPSMSLFNARAEVTGLTPDPTPSLSFDWVAEFKYPTRQKKSFNLNPSFVATAVGGFSPTPSTFFLSGTPAEETMSGGDVVLKVSTLLSGGTPLSAERVDIKVRGTNPDKVDIQTAIQNANTSGDAARTPWLQKIACQESQQRQFATANGGKYTMEGEPVMNRNGDGGMGIMQYTDNSPAHLPNDKRWNLLWNWRKNATAGVTLLNTDKWGFALGYPALLRGSGAKAAALTATNVHRASQSLLPLDNVIIRDYVRSGPLGDELLEDAVRAYNGYGGSDQFGFVLHEFRVRTQDVAGVGTIFLVTNERIEGGQRVADAIWERVPAADRPQTFGEPNYVELVRARSTLCP